GGGGGGGGGVGGGGIFGGGDVCLWRGGGGVGVSRFDEKKRKIWGGGDGFSPPYSVAGALAAGRRNRGDPAPGITPEFSPHAGPLPQWRNEDLLGVHQERATQTLWAQTHRHCA